MIKKAVTGSPTVNWRRAISILLLVALLVPLMVMAPVPAAPAQKVLLAMAAERPEETVRVIVQKRARDSGAEDLVARLGGEVTNDLWIVNAFAAELPAGVVPALARSAGVHWVSLDAPVVSTGAQAAPGAETVRDEFNAVEYWGEDGTANWSDGWQEIGDDDPWWSNPAQGMIQVVSSAYCASGNCLRIGGDKLRIQGVGVSRQADLSAATIALLSFSYRRQIRSAADSAVAVQVSGDGGVSWTTLATYSFDCSDNSQISQSFDITPYMASGIQIRFMGSGNRKVEGYLFVDNVQIAYTGGGDHTYLDTLGVRQVWDMGIQGQGIGVAVIDSGVSDSIDFSSWIGDDYAVAAVYPYYGTRLLAQVALNANATTAADTYGHGTHVAGIVGGSGYLSNGAYTGIAPQANLIGLRISDDTGMAYESDTVAAMQWVLINKDTYNIRVVNLSINSTQEQSYHLSPLTAAAEILWFDDIVVVASVGNKGPAGGYNTANASPANDPIIISVGAADENGTARRSDDSVAPFSAHGTTWDGFYRPDIIAPGYNIISLLSTDSSWNVEHPDRVVLGRYIRLSGTSMAAPMVAGAAALLLQDEPDLTPAQVKYRLTHTASSVGGEPYLDVYAAVTGTTTESANLGIRPHDILCKAALIAYWASENGADSIDWDSVNWDSVNWDSVNWDSVNWDSVNWDSVNWDSVNWDSVNWDSVNWDSVNWDSVNWDSVNWDSVNWDSVNWDSGYGDSVEWNGVFWGKGKGKN